MQRYPLICLKKPLECIPFELVLQVRRLIRHGGMIVSVGDHKHSLLDLLGDPDGVLSPIGHEQQRIRVWADLVLVALSDCLADPGFGRFPREHGPLADLLGNDSSNGRLPAAVYSLDHNEACHKVAIELGDETAAGSRPLL